MVVASVVAAASAPAPARACSFGPPTAHVVDPSLHATDQVPPTLPLLSAPLITRGKGPQGTGCAEGGASCDDLGAIGLLATATDNVTAPERIGYRLTLAGGALPSGLVLPDTSEPTGGAIWLHWTDGATDDQESIDFTLRVVAIDGAGNESGPQ